MVKYPAHVSISFTVSFTDPSKTGILVVEVDGRENGYNKGKTSGFYPGQAVGLLLYKGPGVLHHQTHVSLGGVAFGGGASVEKEETITFSAPDTLSSTLSYPISSVLESYWIGSSLGACSILSDGTVKVNTVRPYGIGVFYIRYLATASSGVLSTPALSLKSYEVAVQVVGTYDPSLLEAP